MTLLPYKGRIVYDTVLTASGEGPAPDIVAALRARLSAVKASGAILSTLPAKPQAVPGPKRGAAGPKASTGPTGSTSARPATAVDTAEDFQVRRLCLIEFARATERFACCFVKGPSPAHFFLTAHRVSISTR